MNGRYQELLKKKKQAREKIAKAKEAMGQGIWHDDSIYENAEMDIRIWTARLVEIEKELKELKEKK